MRSQYIESDACVLACVAQATALALQALGTFEADESIDRALQTRLLSDNLRADAQIGEALLEAGSSVLDPNPGLL